MSEFTDYLVELFSEFGTVSARRMFGGYGLYHDGLMFGLVADDMLYLKADAPLQPRFDALGLAPFTYVKAGKPMQMSYYEAPPDIMESPPLAAQWARWSYEAALRNRPAPRKPKKKATRPPTKKRDSRP